jgi:hypothetical protein
MAATSVPCVYPKAMISKEFIEPKGESEEKVK